MSIPANEAIAMFVAVIMALALVSYLAYGKMMQAGLPALRRRQVLVALWLLVAGLIALLVALRVVSGGPAIGGTPATGGVWLGLQPRQVIALVAAIVLLIIGYTRLRSILQPLESEERAVPPAANTDTDTDTDSESGQDT